MSETRTVKTYATGHVAEYGFGAGLIGVSIALALIGLAISFILLNVEESAWKWVLLSTLGSHGNSPSHLAPVHRLTSVVSVDVICKTYMSTFLE